MIAVMRTLTYIMKYVSHCRWCVAGGSADCSPDSEHGPPGWVNQRGSWWHSQFFRWVNRVFERWFM